MAACQPGTVPSFINPPPLLLNYTFRKTKAASFSQGELDDHRDTLKPQHPRTLASSLRDPVTSTDGITSLTQAGDLWLASEKVSQLHLSGAELRSDQPARGSREAQCKSGAGRSSTCLPTRLVRTLVPSFWRTFLRVLPSALLQPFVFVLLRARRRRRSHRCSRLTRLSDYSLVC